MHHLTSPAAQDPALPRPWLFLAGAIDQGRSEPWQARAVAVLADLPGTVRNPRRAEWDATWGNDLDDPRFATQVAWELDGLEQADVITCWLPAGSQAPTSLLELGLHARRGRLVVGCPVGFHRRGNVQAVCARFRIPLHDNLAAVLSEVRQRLTTSDDLLGPLPDAPPIAAQPRITAEFAAGGIS